MPDTVHKLLMLNKKVIKSCIPPIGQFSEESQEARNEDCRRFREHHTRKQLRISANIDLPNMPLITSDPVINSLKKLHARRSNILRVEVLNMIVPPPIIANCYLSHESFDILYDESSKDSSDECS